MEHPNHPIRKWLIGAAIVVVLIYYGARFATDVMWFRQMQYLGVYLKLVITQVVMSAIAAAIAFLFPYWSLRRARRKVESDDTYIIGSKADDYIDKSMVEEHVDKGILITSVVIGLIFLAGSLHKAMFVLQWYYAEPFGVADPLFNRDVGFFVFKLPLYEWVARSLTSLVLLVTVLTGALYFYEGAIYLGRRSVRVLPHALRHLAALVSVTLILKGITYYLAQFPIVSSQHDLFGGAAYTDVHGMLPVLRVATVLCMLAAIAIQVLTRMDTDVTRAGYVLAGVIGLVIIGKAAYPAVLQYVTVRPRQLTAEKPFIERSIKFTRQAYMLDQINVRDYDIVDQLSAQDLEDNRDTVDSVRLWDHRPLLTAYGQEEQIAPYYAFTDIDLDRYRVNGRLRQVALGTRELYVYGLPAQAQTWVNEHISYTHGYGIAMSPVNEAVGEGMPVYWWSGIPPRRGGGLPQEAMDLKRPAVYFGQHGLPERGGGGTSSRSGMPQANRQTASNATPASVGMMAPSGGGGQQAQPRLGFPEYVLTNTTSPEIDYPSGSMNVQTVYDGADGVPIGGFFRKLAFAIRFKDPVLLLSSEVNADTKLIMYRHILQRANRIFPFIAYDTDPFIFINGSGGLSWIVDTYTYTQRYPYSALHELQPYVSANYARNSVKAVIDAYDGTVVFYQVDANDPIARTFARIFPGLIRPASEMPKDVLQHLRYPRDMFLWQTSALTLYHMEEPEVFYQQEDRWERAQEVFGTRQSSPPDPTSTATTGTSGSVQWERQYMDPYFVLMRPEGRAEVDFMLILPITRYRRPNMASWLSGYWDTQAGLGRMTLYRFPKDSSVYGPMQIESRIDKDPAISQALTLWSGHGSQVIRGNLLAVPLKQTILWVEPIYLQASAEAIPTLQRVVVVFGSKVGGELEKRAGVVMAESFEAALEQAFGKLEGLELDTSPDSAEEVAEPEPFAEPSDIEGQEPPATIEETQAPSIEGETPADTKAMLRSLGQLLDERNRALQDEMETNRRLQELIEQMGQ